MNSFTHNKFWLFFLLFSLTSYGLASCTSGRENDSKGTQSLKVDGSFFIDRNFYSNVDLSSGIYHNSELILLSEIEFPKEVKERIKSTSKEPKVYIKSVQGTQFKFSRFKRMHPVDDVVSEHTYKITLNKLMLKNSGIKIGKEGLKAEGWYEFPDDKVKHYVKFSFKMDPTHCNEYVRLASGKIEEQLGIKIDKSAIRGIQLNLNHPDIDNYLNQLSAYSNLRTLKLQGTRGREIPTALYKMVNLDSIIVTELYSLDIDPLPPASVRSEPIIFPMDFLNLPRLRSIMVEGAKIIIDEEFPENSHIKALHFKNYTLDSLPQTVINLKGLEVLECTYGTIKYSVPRDLNKLKSLQVLKISLPYGELPQGFGPWSNLKELYIYPYIGNSKLHMMNDADLKSIVNTIKADTIYVNGTYH